MTPEEFKQARLDLGLTQEQLAKKVKKSTYTIWRIENKKRNASAGLIEHLKLLIKMKDLTNPT